MGKTSLVQRFVYDRFSEVYKSTIGVSISKKTIQNSDAVMDLMLWDLEGNRAPNSFPANYFRGAGGCVVVFDAFRPVSVHKALELAKAFSDQSPEARCLLVANKVDLVEGFDALHWMDEYRDLDVRFNGFFATSAKTGHGISEMFSAFLTSEGEQ